LDAPFELTPVKCLLVDDVEDNLLALSALLRRDDVEIITACSGTEALERLLTHDVALALLDVQMPEMDGFELAELMRGSERTRDVPIIFITAGARDVHRLFKGYETGAVDFLYKPIEPHILQSKADVFFQLHRHKLQLAQQLQQLGETLRLNELFTATLGHDLRNPLSAILNGAHLLQHSSDQAARDTAAHVLASGKRMGRMIEDMLDSARARLGSGIPLRPDEVDLGEIARGIVQEHQLTSPGSHIELRTEGDLTGLWDGGRLAQVISNLVGNAFQHGAGNAPVHLLLNGTHAQRVTLEVTNEGEIPEGAVARLFDPFCAGRQEGNGLGLGLYIVRQLALAHGGSVSATSERGRTTFRVQLPRHELDRRANL
jgi:signal transduction histidine kinase